jgi:cell wall-associated NlpC family hydrolase
VGGTIAPQHVLGAQTSIAAPFNLETFAARSESRFGPVFGGLSLTGFSGSWGLRVSGSMSGLDVRDNNGNATFRDCNRFSCWSNHFGDNSDGPNVNVNAWSADLDLVAEPFRQVPVLRELALGFSPYAFVGIGHYDTNASSRSIIPDTANKAIWSYGLGVKHDLAARIGFVAEARVRRALDNSAYTGGSFRDAVQYHIGLSVGIGGGRRHNTHEAPRVIWRGPIPGSVPAATPAPVPAPVTMAPAPSSIVDERAPETVVPSLLDEAESLLNTRWRDGGATPDAGFDAGGFVQYVFAQEDIPLPRLVRDLAGTGSPVATRAGALHAGDLLFFSNDGSSPDHVAIYVGHDRFVHASASGGSVMYDVLGEGARGTWFADHLVGARRVLGTRRGESRVPSQSLTPSGRPDAAPRPAGGR